MASKSRPSRDDFGTRIPESTIRRRKPMAPTPPLVWPEFDKPYASIEDVPDMVKQHLVGLYDYGTPVERLSKTFDVPVNWVKLIVCDDENPC